MPHRQTLMPIDDAHRLTEATELLYRQPHPTFLRDGRSSSQAFRPSSGDDGMLSVARSSLVSAEEACARYRARGKLSAGTWAVSLGSKGRREKVADELAAHARARGCQHAA